MQNQKRDTYTRFLLSIDCVVFRISRQQLEILLIKRAQEPFKDAWALPGGFVESQETVEQAALRELQEETGLSKLYLEQCRVYSQPDRDPRAHVVSVSFFSLLNQEQTQSSHSLHASTDAREAKWFAFSKYPRLAFDHKEIVHDAYQKLKESLRRTPIAFEFLPDKFPLSQLQRVYETIFMTTLDKRNFRKKITRAQIVEATDEMQKGVSHRAARLYQKREDIRKNGFFFDL